MQPPRRTAHVLAAEYLATFEAELQQRKLHSVSEDMKAHIIITGPLHGVHHFLETLSGEWQSLHCYTETIIEKKTQVLILNEEEPEMEVWESILQYPFVQYIRVWMKLLLLLMWLLTWMTGYCAWLRSFRKMQH